MRAATVREAAEELGIELREDQLQLVHVCHYMEHRDGLPRLQYFFRIDYDGPVRNCEPDRCAELGWWDPARLPRPIIDYTELAVRSVRAGQMYSSVGWDAQ